MDKKNICKMEELDLSSLKALELPSEDFEFEIDGKKTFKHIHVLGGRGQVALDGIRADRERATAEEKFIEIALIYGADMKEYEAEFFIENYHAQARALAYRIFTFTSDYKKKLAKEEDDAKKKLNPEGSTSTTNTQES